MKMTEQRNTIETCLLLVILIAVFDAGLICMKYLIDNESVSLLMTKMISMVYLTSLLFSFVLFAIPLILVYIFRKRFPGAVVWLFALCAFVVGYGTIYHKFTRILRSSFPDRMPMILAALFFTVLALCILLVKNKQVLLKRVAVLHALILLMVLVPVDHSKKEPTTSSSGKPNVVLIVVDAMRFDRLGCYGDKQGLTPTMDEIAKRAVVYDNAYVHWPSSGPSHSAMLTGKTVFEHAALNGRKLGTEYITLAEVLSKYGYETGGFVENSLLSNKNHFDQGFDIYIVDAVTNLRNASYKVLIDQLVPVSAWYDFLEKDHFTDEAIDWIASNKKRPFFLFLQYFHPHIPYYPPKRFIENESYRGTITGSLEQSRAIRNGTLEVDQDDIQYMIDLYEAEIRYSDEQIRIVYDFLRAQHLFENTLFIITADHGENLFEHTKYFAHGHELYESTVHIPLIISYPGGKGRSSRVSEVIREIDFMPLILTECGIEEKGENEPSKTYVNSAIEILGATCNSQQVLLYTKARQWKYIINLKTMAEELFDLTVDRHELNNVAADYPVLCDSLRTVILDEIDNNDVIREFFGESCIDKKHDKETEKLLRSLGYIE